MEKTDRKSILEKLFSLYKKPMYLYALKITGDSFVSGDIVQEAFCKMMKYIDSVDYENEREIKAYLMTVTRSCAMDNFRKNKDKIHVTNSFEENVIYIEDALEGNNNFNKSMGEMSFDGEIGEIISRLTEEDQHLLYLRYGKEMSDEEIAGTLGLNTSGAVRKRLSRARQRLKSLIENRGRK